MTGTILCLGEVLLRLSSPPGQLLSRATSLDIDVAGAEANVAVALACLGQQSAMMSALPDGPLGDLAIGHLLRFGVDTSRVARGPGRIGQYFLERGGTSRAPRVTYDREYSRFAALRADEVDWEHIFAGVDHLHLSGISPALSSRSATLATEAVRHARAAAVTISFDGNYRQALWDRAGTDARPILVSLVREVDILFGNARDAALLLNGSATDDNASALMFDAFPRLTCIAATERKIMDNANHTLVGRLARRDGAHSTQTVEVSAIVDRIGAGDAFAAGILYGLRTGQGTHEVLASGLALSALKHGLAGDSATFTLADLALPGLSDVVR